MKSWTEVGKLSAFGFLSANWLSVVSLADEHFPLLLVDKDRQINS